MNSDHFQKQIQRLEEVYGAKHYPKERSRLLWQKVQDFSDIWMSATVSNFIEYEQYAPIGSKWDEAIGKERELNWQREKKVHEKEAKEFMSMYSGEDIQTICQVIRNRIQGKMNDEEFGNFMSMLTNAKK